MHRHNLIKLTAAALVLMAFATARAKERHEFYNGVRSLGMGGTVVAVVNDETALIANPAALGKLRNYFVTVADPELDIGADTQSMIGTDLFAMLDPQKILDDAKAHPGKVFHQRAQVFPSFVVTNFGIGAYANYTADGYTDSGATQFNYFYRNDFAAVLGFNFRLFDGRLKLGVNARAINRVESDRTDIPVASTGLKLETQVSGATIASEGFGVASDVGLILTGPWVFLPSLAIVYRDAGATHYTLNSGSFYNTTQRPDPTPATLDAGLSISPILGKGTRMTFSLEMRDAMDATEPTDQEESDEVMRRLHGGVEFNFKDVFFIRGGMNQGYWTAGMEIAVMNSQFQIATYGEEIGDVVPAGSASTYTAVEDRRYVLKYAFRF